MDFSFVLDLASATPPFVMVLNYYNSTLSGSGVASFSYKSWAEM